MKLNTSNLHEEKRENTLVSTEDIDVYYARYLDVCKMFNLTSTITVEELEAVHLRARIFLTEYIRKFPAQKDTALVALTLDENTHYIAQVQDNTVNIGIVANEVMNALNIGGKKTDEHKD